MAERNATIRVLHVDDDEDFTALARRFLDRESDAISVDVEPDPEAARDRLVGDDPEEVDCVVSDLDMPGLDGLSLLESVREARPDLPFILFTGKGSEEVASDAIAAGVTDYLQKSGGSDQFAILANRIENAVAGRRARREIERAERRFRKLIEESVDVVAVFGVDGTFRYLSPAAEAVVGYEPEALVGEDVFEHIHPEDRSRVLDRFSSLFDDGVERVSARCQFRAADGSWVDLDVRGRDLTDDPDVGGVLVYGQDASGRVRRDRELERYETMVNESGDMIYTTDDRGFLTAVNDATISFLGYPREELVGEHVTKIVTEESVERARLAGEALREDEGRDGVTVEQEFVTADGETVPTEMNLTILYDGDGTFTGAVGVVRDITSRKEREQAFRALHEATHRLVAADSRDDVVDVLVSTASDVLGLTLVAVWLYDESERVLRPVVYPDAPAVPDEPPTYREGEGLSWRAFAEGESRVFNDLGSEPGRHNPETAIGSELVVPIGDHGVLNSGSVDAGAFDESDRYLADILARTAAAALDRVEREGELARQNERLEEFASVASHDLRNPLNVAINHVELLDEEVESDRVGRIEEALDRMDALVGDVLTLARGGRDVIDPAPVPLSAVAREAWETAGPAAANLSAEGDLGAVACDRRRLRQLLENLFRNVDEHADGAETVWVGRTPSGFYVEDDGPGVPAAERGRVFESRYTTGEAGTGFGLAIVERIAEAHGWSVDVRAGRDGGARFEITGVESVEDGG